MPDVKWGYGINHFRVPGMSGTGPLLRKENHERALKILSICRFTGVELQARLGTLGTPESIALRYGPPAKFMEFVRSCGLDQVSSFIVGLPGSSPSDPANHSAILESVRPFARFLHDVNGSCLVAQPLLSYWREAPVTEAKIHHAADCWNAVGRMTKQLDVQTVLHPDFLSAIHGTADIDRLLESTDPELVGLALDTAELTIAGVDPLALYEKHPGRVKHFHFKQACSVDSAAEYKLENADNRMLNGWGKPEIERWFWELEAPGGRVDLQALMKSIKQHGYSGWIVVESDRSPHPAESVMMNSWYVRNVLAKI